MCTRVGLSGFLMVLLTAPAFAAEIPADADDPKIARYQQELSEARCEDPKAAEDARFMHALAGRHVDPLPGSAVANTLDSTHNLLPVSASPNSLALAKGKAKPQRMRWFGAALEVGAPDIISVSAIGRPLRWMRLMFGVGTDLVSVGVHGGITVVPFNTKVSPSITIEGGRMFEGDANWILSAFGMSDKTVSGVVKQFGYDYANGHLGLEFGSPNRCMFYIHAGMSYVSMQVHGLQAATGASTTMSTSSVTFSDPNVTLWTPSGKLGLVVYM